MAYAIGTTAPFELSAARVGSKIRLTWTEIGATLEAPSVITGSWARIPNATSPYEQDITGPGQFFRLKK